MKYRQMSNIETFYTDEKGYTLPELLTVMALAGFLGVMVMSVFLFGQGFMKKWNSNVQLTNKTQVLMNAITNDLYRASGIDQVKNNRIALSFEKDSTRVYEVQKGKILLNNQILQIGDISIVNLEFYKVELNDKSVGSSENMENKEFAIEFSLEVAAGSDTISASRLVVPRKPILWKSLDEP